MGWGRAIKGPKNCHVLFEWPLTRINCRKDSESDEVCEEDVETLREGLLQDLPVWQGVDHTLLLLLL